MRIIDGAHIIEEVKKLFIKLNYDPPSLEGISFLEPTMEKDEVDLANILNKNMRIASKEKRPLCQDCGVAQVFIKIGKNISFSDAPKLQNLIERGVEKAYEEGLLRKSTVTDPFERINEGKNLPVFTTIEECDGDTFEIYGIVKGGGSENVSSMKMLSPAEGREGVADFVFDVLKNAAGKGCPPYFAGIGIGGTFDTVPVLAKKALLESSSEDDELLKMINVKI
ncbi:MAG TPA: fumarate hydratase, partial [bacterium]|nr:fumarate hydratase [bacterium]